MRFSGRFKQNLDVKGRLSVPAPLRERLAAEGIDSVVVSATERCLEIYTPRDWDRLVEKFEKLPQQREDVELYGLFFIDPAVELTIDKQGRVLVPPALRDQAQLDKEVMVAGTTGKIQVYGMEVWEQIMEKARSRFATIRNNLSEDL